jgi:hypothetical protein
MEDKKNWIAGRGNAWLLMREQVLDGNLILNKSEVSFRRDVQVPEFKFPSPVHSNL